jgi:proteasome lid subunit RPN8/RPN11
MDLTDEIKYEIKIHAIKESPRECCGFILYHDYYKKPVAIKATNVAIDKLHEVLYDAKEILNIKYLGKLIGLYHSHNNENDFSDIDKECYIQHKIPVILYKVPIDEFSIYEGQDSLSKYTGIDFEIGKNDCYTLIIKYYMDELGIEIPDFLPLRTDGWHKTDINYIDENLKNTSFIKIMPEYIQKNDIIVLDYGKNRFHFGIYLENNLILHHPRNKKSAIENFSKYKDITPYVLRHAKFHRQ